MLSEVPLLTPYPKCPQYFIFPYDSEGIKLLNPRRMKQICMYYFCLLFKLNVIYPSMYLPHPFVKCL